MERPSGSTSERADMVISVHPLCQSLPLAIMNYLDTNGSSRKEGRTTPFVTVVTDLGGAHKTWFNPGYVTYMQNSSPLEPLFSLRTKSLT